jgi:hypothetical protein
VLKGYRFEFAVTGSYAAASNFLTSMNSSQQFLATFDRLDITSKGAGATSSIFTEQVKLSGQMVIWTLLEEPISTTTPTTTVPAATPTTVPQP